MGAFDRVWPNGGFMKKTVLTYGLLSGGLSAALMLVTMKIADRIGFERGGYIGYALQILLALLIFFGVRSYRQNVGGGRLTFGRGFAVGILIALISAACYVATWEVMYFKFMPDFADKYAAYTVEKAKAAGESPEQIAKKEQQAKEFKVMYNKPLVNIAITLMEVLPLGLCATVVSAGVLRRKGGG